MWPRACSPPSVQAVITALAALSDDDATAFEATLAAKGSAPLAGFTITKEMVSFKRTSKLVQEVKFTPSVIEPSFGIGRVLYALLEHSFYARDGDEERRVMRFKPAMAPVKCMIANLQSNDAFTPFVKRIADALTDAGLSSKIDTSGVAIGRKYSRADEVRGAPFVRSCSGWFHSPFVRFVRGFHSPRSYDTRVSHSRRASSCLVVPRRSSSVPRRFQVGTPFGVTVDFQTLEADTVTLRERDSSAQVRMPIADVPGVLRAIVDEAGTWAAVMARYPVVTTGEAGGDAAAGGGAAPSATAAAVTVESHGLRGKFSRPAVPILGKK